MSLLPPRFSEARVSAAKALSRHMVRLTFEVPFAEELADQIPGSYLKVIAPQIGDQKPRDINALNFKPHMRTYTIRKVRPADSTIDIDFVVHGDQGIAGPWAAQAKVGDVVYLSRPGALKFETGAMKAYRFAADMAALPAVAAIVETLDHDARGDAFFEILSDEDRQEISAPPALNIHWIVKEDCAAPSSELIHAIKETPWPDGDVGIFFAGEFATARELRTYYKDREVASKSATYISSYWKIGLVEPEHKVAKAQAA